MKPWTQRTVEEANLLNPSFCCVALTAFTCGYETVQKAGVPFPLPFLALPIMLHKATRENVPRSSATSLGIWIQDNAIAKVGFQSRVEALAPHTREAILFGLNQNWLVLTPRSFLSCPFSQSQLDRRVRSLNAATKEYIRKGKIVGKWLALAGSSETVMALWGIRA